MLRAGWGGGGLKVCVDGGGGALDQEGADLAVGFAVVVGDVDKGLAALQLGPELVFGDAEECSGLGEVAAIEYAVTVGFDAVLDAFADPLGKAARAEAEIVGGLVDGGLQSIGRDAELAGQGVQELVFLDGVVSLVPVGVLVWASTTPPTAVMPSRATRPRVPTPRRIRFISRSVFVGGAAGFRCTVHR